MYHGEEEVYLGNTQPRNLIEQENVTHVIDDSFVNDELEDDEDVDRVDEMMENVC